MVENRPGEPKKRQDDFNDRYGGLTRAEVALREKMARKFGRVAKHLDRTV